MIRLGKGAIYTLSQRFARTGQYFVHGTQWLSSGAGQVLGGHLFAVKIGDELAFSRSKLLQASRERIAPLVGVGFMGPRRGHRLQDGVVEPHPGFGRPAAKVANLDDRKSERPPQELLRGIV